MPRTAVVPALVLGELEKARGLLDVDPDAAHRMAMRIGLQQSSPDHIAARDVRAEIRRRAIEIADRARVLQRTTLRPAR